MATARSAMIARWRRGPTRVRRLVARRPWVQWVVIVLLAAGVSAGVRQRLTALDTARREWGRSVTVWVAEEEAAVGDPLAARSMQVPAAIVPPGAVIEGPHGMRARRAVGPGEIVTTADVMATGDDIALAPPGWLVAPVVERPSSGARMGERVQITTGGIVVVPHAVVVATGVGDDGVTLVAVPAEQAPLVPAAAETAWVTLLREP